MIFCHGYVHGDPHPGNILVHRDPSRSGKHNFDIGWFYYHTLCRQVFLDCVVLFKLQEDGVDM